VWPEARERALRLAKARGTIKVFRDNYRQYLELNVKAKATLLQEIGAIYRDCQEFSTARIKKAVEDVSRELVSVKVVEPNQVVS
jgi:hypothetical protein